MRTLWSLRRMAVALLLLVAFLSQGTWALAGTTGGLSGTVTDDKGAPVAGATVKAVSPSQAASQTTDASGHFGFLSLAADTYTVSIEKTGFNPASYTGVTVFADQQLALSFKLTPSLKVIANTTSRSAGNLVSSRTSDVYAVSAAQQNAVSGVGGGYNLDSAYSGIYSQPGVQGQVGVYGFGQVFYIRGSSYSQVGYEFDGVPVNRAFDQYNANSVSNLGTQQTEVYTGGSPAGATSATLGGYINQVIKTGTYPGTAQFTGGIGAPTFYHKLDFEGGGSTPDRLFSYYVALRGANTDYPFINTQNGGNLPSDGSGQYGISGYAINGPIYGFGNYTNGPWSTCSNTGAAPAGGQTFNLQYALGAPTAIPVPACNYYGPLAATAAGFAQYTADRENVINLHFGIPHHHDGGKDDIQVLFDNFGYLSRYFDGINANGGLAAINAGAASYGGPGGITQGIFGVTGYPGEGGPNDNICALNALFGFACATGGGSPLPYIDKEIFAPGTSFGQNASSASVVPYLAPSTGTQRPAGQGVALNQASGIWNNGSIVKLQYQKNIGSNAFVRLMGYTFYSDWLQNSPSAGSYYFASAAGYNGVGVSYPSPDYELSTHTRGIQLDAEDQVNPQNLVSVTGNYTTANATRWNNEFWGAPTAATNLTNGTECFSATTGLAGSCLSGSTAGTYGSPTTGWTTNSACANLPGSPACAANARFQVTIPGSYGPLNQVTPKFSNVALTDEFRPNDKLDLNVGVRYENYTYDFPSTVSSEFNFWFNSAQSSYCYDPRTGQPLLTPITPTTPASRQAPLVLPNNVAGQNAALCYQPGTLTAFTAPSGATAVHPNGLDGNGLFSNNGLASVSHPLWSPRIGATYTFDPDTVLRVSGGRYTEPTPTAYEQYSNASGRGAATFDFTHFWGLGFDTPVHNNPVQTSNNYDLSLEHHFKNSDWSAKVSPFYRYTTNQLVTVSLGNNFASAINAGTQKTTGVEVAIQKGDPSRDGWSGQLAYTFTHAVMKYNTLANGSSTIDNLNGFIRSYNGLTSYCAAHATASQCPTGGADAFPFYCAGTTGGPNGTNTGAASAAACAPLGGTAIANPYYNTPVQGLLDPGGFYPTYANEPPYTAPDNIGDTSISPNQFTGFINYKHQRWSATVQGILQQGQSYGSPVAVIGLDPRNCAANQSGVAGVGPTSPYALDANYQSCGSSSFTTSGSLAIPNPVTGRFDSLSQYREPWQLNMGLQFGYDISTKIHAQLTLANLVNACFGGSSEPWTSAYPATSNCYVAAYFPNGGNYIGTQPGAGFFYGASGKDAANGTAPYPNWINQPYGPVENGLPFQAYLNVQVKL